MGKGMLFKEKESNVKSGKWGVLFAAFIMMFSGVGLGINCLSLFFKPVIADLGFSRTEISLTMTIIYLASMLASPFLGYFLARYSMKVVITVCAIVTGLSYAFLSLSSTLRGFYLISFVTGAFRMGCSTLPAAMLINNWFDDKKGMALGIALAGSGVGGMIFNPLTNWVIFHHGWRWAYIMLGTVIIMTILPVTWLMVKEVRPVVDKEEKGGQVVSGLFVSRALKSPFFWITGLAVLFMTITSFGIQMHIPAYLTDIGYSPAMAAFVVSGFMGMLILGKIILGAVLDRYGVKKAVVYITATYLISILTFMHASNRFMLVLFVVFFGLNNACVTVLLPYLTSHLFGAKDYGCIYGALNVFSTLGFAVGPPLSGLIFDKTGGYQSAFWLYLALALLTMFMYLAVLKTKESGRLHRCQ